jgi:hypothetical protein
MAVGCVRSELRVAPQAPLRASRNSKWLGEGYEANGVGSPRSMF